MRKNHRRFLSAVLTVALAVLVFCLPTAALAAEEPTPESGATPPPNGGWVEPDPGSEGSEGDSEVESGSSLGSGGDSAPAPKPEPSGSGSAPAPAPPPVVETPTVEEGTESTPATETPEVTEEVVPAPAAEKPKPKPSVGGGAAVLGVSTSSAEEAAKNLAPSVPVADLADQGGSGSSLALLVFACLLALALAAGAGRFGLQRRRRRRRWDQEAAEWQAAVRRLH